jgi:hypothetical protein
MHALGMRYLERMRETFGPLLSAESAELPLQIWIARIVDALDTSQTTNKGFKELLCSAALTPELAAAENAMHHQLILGLDSALAARVPQIDADRRRICAEVGVRTAEALMPLLAESTGEQHVMVREEIQAVLVSYVAHAHAEAQTP